MVIKLTGTNVVLDVDVKEALKKLRKTENVQDFLEIVEEEFGVIFVDKKDGDDWVNVKKSMGTEPFYNLLVDAIEAGDLNLELLIGKVAMKKLLKDGKAIEHQGQKE